MLGLGLLHINAVVGAVIMVLIIISIVGIIRIIRAPKYLGLITFCLWDEPNVELFTSASLGTLSEWLLGLYWAYC